MNAVSLEALAAIDELHARYAEALDAQDMAAWLATFEDVPTASYVCTTAESHEAGRRVALILDDCHARLQDRVTFVTRIWAGTYQDYRTRHVIQRTAWNRADGGDYETRSNFIVACTHSDTRLTESFISGRYLDRIRIGADGARLVARKAVVDGAMLPRYIAYPL